MTSDPTAHAIRRELRNRIPVVTVDNSPCYMAAMINEGANVVHQRIALRPLDVDVTFLYGYGFARHRGRCNTPTPLVLRRCSPTSASSPNSTRCSGKRRR